MKNELKITHIWSVICTGNSVDQATNNISLYNILEQLNIPKEALKIHKEESNKEKMININFEIVSFWKKKTKDENILAEEQIEIIDPQGKILGIQKFPFKIPANNQRMRFILSMNGFKMTIPGDYIFQISARDSEKNDFVAVASLPLQIAIAENL